MSNFIFYNNSRVKNLTGEIFGEMKAIEVVGIKNRYAVWKFACLKCGATREISVKRINANSILKCQKCHAKVNKETNPKTKRKKIAPEDIIGKNFGSWYVVEKAECSKRGQLYLCKCKCGTERKITAGNLINGFTTSCGCSRKLDIAGQKFGFLTAIEPYQSGSKGVIWKCKCECGNYFNASCSDLRSKNKRSCGCMGDIEKNKHTKIVWAKNGGQRLRSNNISGVRGVNKANGKWGARITFQKKAYWLGTFDTIEQATEARRMAEKKIYGNFVQWYSEDYPAIQKEIIQKHKN